VTTCSANQVLPAPGSPVSTTTRSCPARASSTTVRSTSCSVVRPTSRTPVHSLGSASPHLTIRVGPWSGVPPPSPPRGRWHPWSAVGRHVPTRVRSPQSTEDTCPSGCVTRLPLPTLAAAGSSVAGSGKESHMSALRDVIARMAVDSEFARHARANPDQVAREHGLTAEEAARLRGLADAGRGGAPMALGARLAKSGFGTGGLAAAAAEALEGLEELQDESQPGPPNDE